MENEALLILRNVDFVFRCKTKSRQVSTRYATCAVG